jgi:hypothetical protein
VFSNPEDTLESNYSSWATAAVRACEGFVTGSRLGSDRVARAPRADDRQKTHDERKNTQDGGGGAREEHGERAPRHRHRLNEPFFERSSQNDPEDHRPDGYLPSLQHESKHAHCQHDRDIEIAARDRVRPEHAEQDDDRQQRLSRHANELRARAHGKKPRRQQREVGEDEHQIEAVDESPMTAVDSHTTIRETLPASTDTQAAAPTSSMNSATKARFLFRGLFLYRLLRTKSVIRVVNHERCDLPSGVGLLHQVDDAGPLQFFSVGLATYGDAPGDHGGCAQPFEVKVD